MAERELRGPVGAPLFANRRLLNDQALENATRAGAPSWAWPAGEQLIDLAHRGGHAVVTSLVADRLIAGPPGVPKRRRPGALR